MEIVFFALWSFAMIGLGIFAGWHWCTGWFIAEHDYNGKFYNALKADTERKILLEGHVGPKGVGGEIERKCELRS